MPNGRDSDSWAKVLALATFLLGIGLMLLVFLWAANLFNEIGVGKKIAFQTNPSERTPLAEWLIHWLIKVALLFVLGYLASLIAARGANLYLVTRTRQRGEE